MYPVVRRDTLCDSGVMNPPVSGRQERRYQRDEPAGVRDMSKPGSKKTSIPFSRPAIGEEEMAEVAGVLRSGWLTSGPKTREFEEAFADNLGGDVTTVAVNSATAGLHLALEALGIGPGDEVIVPVYTFTATAAVVCHVGATPVFVDIRPDSLNIDPEAIESAITDRTRAIIPVHFAGLACDMDRILGIARRHGLYVVEDAAHALPARYNGTLVGALGSDATVFSFYANKTMTTGEGGMIATRNADLAGRCRVMRLHGIDQALFDRYYERYRMTDKPAWFYQVVAAGFKYNMTDLAAAIGIHQLRKIYEFQSAREAITRRYDDAFADLPLTLPTKCENDSCLHAWHLYAVRLNEANLAITRNDFIDLLRGDGIGSSVHFIPFHLHPFWRDSYHLTAEKFPVADRVFQAVVSLPLFSAMTTEEVDTVIATVRRICREHAM